jgi:hypothetical protein
MPAVNLLHRIVMLILLLTVPFQAAVGATGWVCANGGHSPGFAVTDDSHDDSPPTHAHTNLHAQVAHAAGATGDTTNDSPSSSSGAGSCSLCSECSFSAAPVPAPQSEVIPGTSSTVSRIVRSAATSRAGDGLFRPPRITSL